MLDAFKTALKHVPTDCRCQHCYTTAAMMPLIYCDKAIALIDHGLTVFPVSPTDRMRAYHNKALIFEAAKDFEKAQDSYKEALAVSRDINPAYVHEYSAHLLRTEMHVSGFEYTKELEKYYKSAVEADGFSRSFMKKDFYRLVAEVIIFDHHCEVSKANLSLDYAVEMLRPDYVGLLTKMLKKHGLTEEIAATDEARAFLNKRNGLH